MNRRLSRIRCLNQRGLSRRHAVDARAYTQIDNLLTNYGAGGEEAPFSGDGFFFFRFFFFSYTAAIFRCLSVAPRRGSTSASQFALSFRCLLRRLRVELT